MWPYIEPYFVCRTALELHQAYWLDPSVETRIELVIFFSGRGGGARN